MINTNRIRVIVRDIHLALEDIIVKLNENTPDKLYDDITNIIEDCEILEQAVTTPQDKEPQVPVTGNENTLEHLFNTLKGLNGPDISVSKVEIEVLPSFVFKDLFETTIRLGERLSFESEMLIGQELNAQKVANINTIRLYMDHLRSIADYLMSLEHESYDALQQELDLENNNIKADEEEEDDADE